MSLWEGIVVLIVALGTAGVAAWLMRLPEGPPRPAEPEGPDPLLLLFDGGMLKHASQRALTTFAFLPGTHVWEDLRRELLPRFPDFPETSGPDLSGHASIEAARRDDPALVDLTWRDGLCWVEIKEHPAPQNGTLHTAGDIAALRACMNAIPDPAWELRETGELGWHNHAFEVLHAKLSEAGPNPMTNLAQDDAPVRLQVTDVGTKPTHYEVTTHPLGAGYLCYARDVTEVVEAEASQQGFVQILSNTFAHLSIGLAIFDRRGQLSIFNPALTDLTGLFPSFLASRPTVMSFFDELRENRLMPEPKDYASWRQGITEMIDTATGGVYKDTWTLDDGRTFGIQGRPHADGAIAFMFEDISSEIALTRNYRIEVEQYAQLLDTVEEALVVFSSSGVLTFCNAAYRAMWQHSPESAFADVTFKDAIDLWGETAQADWAEILHRFKALKPQGKEAFTLTTRQGAQMHCVLSHILPDATLIRFDTLQESTSLLDAKTA